MVKVLHYFNDCRTIAVENGLLSITIEKTTCKHCLVRLGLHKIKRKKAVIDTTHSKEAYARMDDVYNKNKKLRQLKKNLRASGKISYL